jgi:transcriptional regulator with XRE-family HTH domain
MTGERLRRLRKRLKLSQEGLARLLGVSFATVNRWETIENVSGPKGAVYVVLVSLESAVALDPSLGQKLPGWEQYGQAHVLHKILSLAQGAHPALQKRR